MGYQITLASLARDDLRDIVRYVSLNSPEWAVAFGQFLVSNIRRLGDDRPRLVKGCPRLANGPPGMVNNYPVLVIRSLRRSSS